MNGNVIAGFLLIVAMAPGLAGAQSAWSVEPFMPFSSGGYFYGINNKQEIVGYKNSNPFIWDKFGNETKIDLLGCPESYRCAAYGYGINDFSQVVGASSSDNGWFSYYMQAFLYDSGSVYQVMTIGWEWSEARDISNNGVIVGSARSVGSYTTHAYKQMYSTYGDGLNAIDLGTLVGPKGTSYAKKVSESGWVVGGSSVSLDTYPPYHAVVWDPEGNMYDIGTLGGRHSFGEDINNLGHAVGFSYIEGDAGTAAFYWDGALKKLPTPEVVDPNTGKMYEEASALSINNSDVIVGYFTDYERGKDWRGFWRTYKVRKPVVWVNGDYILLNESIDNNEEWEVLGAYFIDDFNRILARVRNKSTQELYYSWLYPKE